MLNIHNLAILAGLMTAVSVQAEESFRQHDAHVHGVVEMDIAQDEHQLLIEFTTPGMDIVGYEHPPQTEQEHQALNQAIETLKQADNLITINAEAGCHIEQSDVHQTTHHHDDEDHDHAAHDADQHHDDGDEDDHEHEHEHDHEHGHSAFAIEYHYTCQHVDALKQLSTQWFVHFPRTHEIHTNIFTDHRQTATTLNPQQTNVSL